MTTNRRTSGKPNINADRIELYRRMILWKDGKPWDALLESLARKPLNGYSTSKEKA